ncbi:hypothetical protein P1X14_09480 [Sphingomonas sp. AOB5]|uniref:hypothetical protein n=1 Tax=Sphingomonas sp. AOB5 TaxID=3034017 RepID=UPI0023F72361|nr:hypothetical protein [Sphingomonas sp. AOB5]MDF7775478.1 hypothetical protein [Sphingomonas sp. AOB5]
MHARPLRVALALALSLPLAACWERPDLVANWYLAPAPLPDGPTDIPAPVWEPASAESADPAVTETGATAVGSAARNDNRSAAEPLPPVPPPTIYVALLNRDRTDVHVQGVTLDDPRQAPPELMDGKRNAYGPATLRPRHLLVLHVGEVPAGPAPASCDGPLDPGIVVPVRLFVRFGPPGKKAKIMEVAMQQPMPSTLPYEWQTRCTAAGTPTR